MKYGFTEIGTDKPRVGVANAGVSGGAWWIIVVVYGVVFGPDLEALSPACTDTILKILKMHSYSL